MGEQSLGGLKLDTDTHSTQDQRHNNNTKTSSCLTVRPSSRTLTCPRRCSRTPWIVLLRHLRNTTLRRISLPTSRKSLTKSTTQPGIASWAGISGPTSPTRPGISSTSTLVRWPSCCSRAGRSARPDTPSISSVSPGCSYSIQLSFQHLKQHRTQFYHPAWQPGNIVSLDNIVVYVP